MDKVQQRIKELEVRAESFISTRHNLKLVVNDAVNSVRDINDLFSLLQTVTGFFGNTLY